MKAVDRLRRPGLIPFPEMVVMAEACAQEYAGCENCPDLRACRKAWDGRSDRFNLNYYPVALPNFSALLKERARKTLD